MKYKGIIFDLDGVICSTDGYHYEAWSMLAKKLGITDFTKADNDRQRGVSRMESLEVVLEKLPDRSFSQEEKLALATEKNQYYVSLLSSMTPNDVSCEVTDTLSTLRAQGLSLAIGSSSKNTKYILSRIGLGDFFDAVSDGNNITHSKPDPEVFLTAAQMIGLKPCDCLVIEDARAGIEAAHRGGFDSVAISDAVNSPFATYRINSFSDILNLI